MPDLIPCPSCHRPTSPVLLSEAHEYAFWHKPDGACPACVQRDLLHTLLSQGDAALHTQIQSVWPLDAGAAVALAIHQQHVNHAAASASLNTNYSALLHAGSNHITFVLHDHAAQRVQVLGSWNDWQSPGLEMEQVEPGVWQAERPLLAHGHYQYKFLLDGSRWLDDPANPRKVWDGFAGFNSLLTTCRI